MTEHGTDPNPEHPDGGQRYVEALAKRLIGDLEQVGAGVAVGRLDTSHEHMPDLLGWLYTYGLFKAHEAIGKGCPPFNYATYDTTMGLIRPTVPSYPSSVKIYAMLMGAHGPAVWFEFGYSQKIYKNGWLASKQIFGVKGPPSGAALFFEIESRHVGVGESKGRRLWGNGNQVDVGPNETAQFCQDALLAFVMLQ